MKERDWSDDCQGVVYSCWTWVGWFKRDTMTCLESHQSTRPAAQPEQMLIWIIFEIEKSSFTISIHVDCHLQKQWKSYSLPFISTAILLVIFMMHYTSNPANGHFSTHGLSILNQIYPIHTAICVRDTNLGRFLSYGDLPFHWWQ